jgi:quinoprotein glucose dehydrogenase
VPEAAGGAAPGAATPPAGRGGGGLQVEGLPIVKPPYGVLAAIDLDRGELKFQVPHGDTPDAVRNSPALQGMTIPKTGQNSSVGLMVTKTLVILGDGQVTAPPGRPRGAMLRAYDKNNGTEVGAVWLPAGQSGSPMTYMADGRQYIVVAVSGGIYSGEYIAFALPNAPRNTSLGQQ